VYFIVFAAGAVAAKVVREIQPTGAEARD